MTREQLEQPVGLREYLEERRYFHQQQYTALAERVKESSAAIQSGLEKSERDLRNALVEAEKRSNEKFDERDKSLQRSMDVFDERINQSTKQIAQFREDRTNYVTRDRLEADLQDVKKDLDIVSRAITLSAGKDAGVSRVWFFIGMLFSIGSSVAAGVTAVSALMRVMH